MPKETNLELKVGAFVLLAIGCLTLAILSISDFSFFEKGRTIHVVFGYANGLKKAAPVRLAGVEAGVVKSIDILTEGAGMKVNVDLWIQDEIVIPSDSRISINQLGLLGEKYVEITPGQSQMVMQENGTMNGIDPIPVEKITLRIDSLTSKLEQTMDSINNGVLTQENKEAFAMIMQNVQLIVAQIQQGKGTLGQLLYNPSIFNNMDELTADLKDNPWKLLYRPRPGKK